MSDKTMQERFTDYLDYVDCDGFLATYDDCKNEEGLYYHLALEDDEITRLRDLFIAAHAVNPLVADDAQAWTFGDAFVKFAEALEDGPRPLTVGDWDLRKEGW
jgi:hypothetical protein